jgi:hypothetical protein
MPDAILRIQGEAGMRVTDVRDYLARLEHAYNSVLAFEQTISAAERLARRWHGPIFTFDPFGWPSLPPRAGRLSSSWPPSQEVIASVIPARDRLVLRAARFESPGFWEFAGTLNPLEVIRQYLKDRHDRQRDQAYRDAAEARRLELENNLLENRVIRERVELAKSLGATDSDLAPLINELVYRPLRGLNGPQDEGMIDSAELTQEVNKS